MPVVSVVMAVYNTKEEYLREAVESILNQTFNDFEFIIINDGSTNNAEEVIQSYSDERIKYIKQENKGHSVALNKGIELSQGEYIVRMDSDDVSHPDRLEKQILFMDNNPQYTVVGSWVKIINSDEILKQPAYVKMMDLLADCCIIHPSTVFRKSDFDKYKLKYDETLICAEDYNLWADVIKYSKIANIQEVLLDYRVHKNNLSTSKKKERVVGSFIVQDKIFDYLSNDKTIRNKILDIAYLKKNKTNSLAEKIFSIKNLYKNWAKYKIITILGVELKILVKRYKHA